MRNRNKSLFWYGFKSRLMIIFGILMILSGIMSFFFNIILAIILIVVGFILLFKGASSEYDYKRQGGYIVYND